MAERRFTLKQYEDYLNWPVWKLDDDEWSEDDYHAHWASTIGSWRTSYKEAYGALVDEWKSAIEYVERMPGTSDFDTFDPAARCARSRIPYAISAIRQQISMLFCNYPQPQYTSPSMPMDKYVQVLSQNNTIELKANGFSSLAFDLGTDISFAGWGCLKAYVDTDEPGPFGKDGKITISKMDPASMWVDPKAKRLKWADMQFLGVDDDMDLSTALRMFPGARHRLDEAMKGQMKPDQDGMFGRHLLSPVSAVGEGNTTGRDKIRISEVWFKDDREKFVADEKTVENYPTKVADDGTVSANPDYDPEKPEIYEVPETDDTGHVVGRWVPAYPDGRCIVLGGDSKVVQDFKNPYWHRQAPYIFYRGNPSRKLFPVGDLVEIVKIDAKINDLLSRYHIMAQQEIERPMIADNRAFRPAIRIYRLSGQPTSICVIQQGSQFFRMKTEETPQFPWTLLQNYFKAMDTVMAMAGVMRGDLTEGSQLSAEAVGNLQNMAAGMLKMKVEFIAEGMKDLGYQMMWLQRETYDDGIQIPVTLPDGSQETVDWHEKEAATDYLVDIQAGTGLPGAEAARGQQARSDFRNNLIDRPKALQMCGYDDATQICQRIDAREKESIETDAAGRAMGIYLKKILEPGNPSGAAGRKEKD